MRGRAGRSVFAENLSDVDGCANHRGQRIRLQQDFAQFPRLVTGFSSQMTQSFGASIAIFPDWIKHAT
jgi:hypothetical protein